MDLTSIQKKAVFVGIVLILALLGYVIVRPHAQHPHPQAQPSQQPSQTQPTTQPAQQPTQQPQTAANNLNIYNWLPFTQQDLATAASVATRFAVDYNTFSYKESSDAYINSMQGLITPQLATTLKQAYSTSGVATLRNNEQQVSTGTAAIGQLRAFGPSSITFVVMTAQQLVTTTKTTHGNAQYTVTVTGSGASWLVSDIELAGVGNQ